MAPVSPAVNILEHSNEFTGDVMKYRTAIRWYRPTSCGYYKHGYPDTPVFGSLDYLMDELVHFTKNKKLSQTRLLADQTVLQTYVAGISESNGVYAVVLWNQVNSTGRTVNSLPGDALVGQAKAEKTKVKKGNIPGYPTYFLVLPEYEAIGVLRVIDNVSGLDAFKKYAGMFLEASTRSVVSEMDGGNVSIKGYREKKQDPIQALFPRFALQVRRDETRAQFIRDNAAKVRKVIRLRTLDVQQNPSDFAAWQGFLKWVGLSSSHASKSEMRVKNEVDVNNDASSIIKLVDENENAVVAHENDFGFIMTGGGDPHWLSNAICSATIELELVAENGVFSAVQISQAAGKAKVTLSKTIL